MSMVFTSGKAAKVAAVASFALLMSVGAVSTAQAAPSRTASVAADCVSAGGGTWCRGSGVSGASKSCHSNYVHPNNYHSSTAALGAANDKRYANAGSWSNAYVTNGFKWTCNTWYNPNA
ncbi:Bacteriocin (Lactococcin_972) [Amycolatopsis lurida]|nr:Bacteriocin (Lactococcin_972) [Amycolatopsis lurida]